jgi:P-type E1-E2 ATPase
MENFDDAILKILIVAAIVTLVIGIIEKGWLLGSVDGVSILMAIVIIILVTTGNNYSKEKQFQKLVAKAKTDYTPVFRGEQGTITVNSEELVVGDVFKFKSGDRIPADCIMISGSDVSINEADFTGENEACRKENLTEENYSSMPNPFIL